VNFIFSLPPDLMRPKQRMKSTLFSSFFTEFLFQADVFW